MIKIEKISKVFGTGQASVTALHEVSFSILENEFFTLLGPSGCGKTTLLRMIAGFEPPSGGALVLDGTDISQMPPNKRPVNTVFQNYALFPHMTVAENIAFGLQTLKRPKAEIAETVKRTLAQVRMEHLKDRKTSQLSGGQQQRVALARAMAPRPRILLLDEPLSALDLKLRKEMQIELKRLQHETGLTFIFVTHDQEEALTMSDRIAVMSGGHVHQIATPRELYEYPADRFVAGFIGETNFIKAHLAEVTNDRATVEIEQVGRVEVPIHGKTYPKGPVTLMVRPEHLSFGEPRTPAEDVMNLPVKITQLVYLGTDTHVHASLPNGAPLTARIQNDLQSGIQMSVGEMANLVIPKRALRLVQE